MVEARSKQALEARAPPRSVGRRWVHRLQDRRRRVQQNLTGHRGHRGDPLYAARRSLHTGANLLTEKQLARLDALFAHDERVETEAT